MTQTGAMVDIVGAEAGAHQLLEQVGLFVTALGAAENRPGPVRPAYRKMERRPSAAVSSASSQLASRK